MGFCGNISFHFPETNVQEDAGVNIILVPWEPAEKCLTFFPGQAIYLPVWLCLWCIKRAAGLASKSFLPILWFVHSWICSHVAGNRLIASPVLLSSSAFRGSFFFFSFFFLLNIYLAVLGQNYSTCCALSLLSPDSAPSATWLFPALESGILCPSCFETHRLT